MNQIGQSLVGIGVILVVVGGIFVLLGGHGWPKLPGDIVIEKNNFRFYAPITTSILISIILSLILGWWGKR